MTSRVADVVAVEPAVGAQTDGGVAHFQVRGAEIMADTRANKPA